MPKENQTDPRKNFVPRFLPWVLGGAMLVVFGATLNHWVTLLNIGQIAMVSGWIWQPSIFNPLTYLVTLPFHWVPTAHVPLAMNVFSALCAAATLAVLARSVAILPHDRTEMERARERSDFSFLTSWVAWVPPIAAVSFAGLQLGFWENATSFSGESFELLWFAVILWQLLEYRLDEWEARLFLAAFMYGAGLTENWAMVGFFPVFVMMIVWLRKLDFFDVHFLLRLVIWGLAGLLLLFLLPLHAKFSAAYPLTIWEGLKPGLRADWQLVRMLFDRQDIRHSLGLMILTSLLPAFIMAIRWSSSFGDSSRMGATLVNYMMHCVNAVLLGILVWVMFDPPFSPHQLLQQAGIAAPALTFYYIVALCIGYYSGYCLLVFGRKPIPSRRTSQPDPAVPKSLLWLCPILVVGELAILAIAAGFLVYKNAPVIRAVNDDSLLKYAQFAAQNLPPEGAILLCDSDEPGQDQPFRAFLLQAVLAREGRTQSFPVVDTQSLNWTAYHKYLHEHFPKVWPQTVTTNDTLSLSPIRIFVLLNQLSKTNQLFYLNPSFGYYFEQFYQEPHGLIYAMKPVPAGVFLPPPLDKKLMAENESFWDQVLDASRPGIEAALHPRDYTQLSGVTGWLMVHLHVPSESNPNALMAAGYYSHGLNSLGVQVQRAGELSQAATLFREAHELNSNNVVANINLAFNKTLSTRGATTLDPTRVTADQFGNYRNWNEVLAANGPFDDPSFCFEQAIWLMQSGLMRQAAVAFDRVCQLAPDNLATRLFLAQIYIISRQPDQALATLHDPLTQPSRFALTQFNSTELNVLAASAHFQKNENSAGVNLLESEMVRHPDDEMLLLASAQAFNMRGLYTNALRAINRKLDRSPNDPTWLYGKGIVCLQTGDYTQAVAALSRFLEIQTNNPDAMFNRGIAYLKSDHFDAARADFLKLQAAYTNNFQVAYGLGEVAWHQHHTNDAIRNYELYLAHAPTNSAELKTVRDRLTQLDSK
jgi:tetratricopeptide (TPR) repeat protein